MPVRSLFLLVPTAALTACAVAESNPPSLAHREIEGILDEPIRAIAPVDSTSDATLAQRIDALVAQAQSGQRAFDSALPAARSRAQAARGAAIESESWIAAQLALSALDGTRVDTANALGELDSIFARQAASGDYVETAKLSSARERVLALYEAQTSAYEALLALVPSG